MYAPSKGSRSNAPLHECRTPSATLCRPSMMIHSPWYFSPPSFKFQAASYPLYNCASASGQVGPMVDYWRPLLRQKQCTAAAVYACTPPSLPLQGIRNCLSSHRSQGPQVSKLLKTLEVCMGAGQSDIGTLGSYYLKARVATAHIKLHW